MIDDALWCHAVSLLPVWCRARCYASTSTVELEFDYEEARKPYNDLADVRADFFGALGGDWRIFDREHRFKTVVCRYRKA